MSAQTEKQLTFNTEPVIARPNSSSIVDALRKACATNPAFDAVCSVFAKRERARQQITLSALMHRMQLEGYQHTKSDYINVLKYLANLGIGTLDVDQKHNQVRALKNIRLTLQSIGQAATSSGSTSIEKFEPAFEYKKLQSAQKLKTEQPMAAVAAPMAPPVAEPRLMVSLTTTINGAKVDFPLAKGVTLQEFGELLANLSSSKVRGA